MTTDSRRKAFEKWFVRDFENYCIYHGTDKIFLQNHEGKYFDGLTSYAWRAYNAAHERILAMLDAPEMAEAMAKALCWKEHEGCIGADSPEESWASWHSNYETLAEAAIAAIKERIG